MVYIYDITLSATSQWRFLSMESIIIEKLKLTAQVIHMQITMIYILYMCK